ncbi:hypothetical protein M3G04_09610 [Dietzia cinnamea]|uniref:hypothetical protein n=1 Tax=Dietzia cinnamea TaxID=321318 RepID=UPI00223BA1D6|nr:hypothetical protein [Dietzia cinnamea]MCT2301141.1 hypothetical protein [Dietzia cinnamea]
MSATTLTQLLTRTKAGHDCYLDAARLASDGDLAAAAVMARYSVDAYADAAEITAGLDGGNIGRPRIYAACAEKSANVAAGMAELATLAGSDPLKDAAVSAELAARAVRRARIAVNPRLNDDDSSAAGLDAASEIAEAFATVSQFADETVTHADAAARFADECANTQVAQDAQDLAARSRAAAAKAVQAAGRALGLAPSAYSTGATAAPDRADYAVTAATVADRAATKAERHAEQKTASEAVTSLRSRIADPR